MLGLALGLALMSGIGFGVWNKMAKVIQNGLIETKKMTFCIVCVCLRLMLICRNLKSHLFRCCQANLDDNLAEKSFRQDLSIVAN